MRMRMNAESVLFRREKERKREWEKERVKEA